MIPLPDNSDLFCYYVTKHSSWRGKYKRIFSIGSCGISTYDPDSGDVTNSWHYSDVISLKPCGPDYKFSITARKDKSKKVDTMFFSSDHRCEIVSLAYKLKQKYPDPNIEVVRYDAFKIHWSGTRLPITLCVTPVSLDQVDTATNVVLASYLFKDIEAVSDVTNIPGCFQVACSPNLRKHFFICGNRNELFDRLKRNSSSYLSHDLKCDSAAVVQEDMCDLRLGKFNEDECTTSVVEFPVEKVGSLRHKGAVQRLLCLSPTCLLERDPETYHVVTIRPLVGIFAVIRNAENPRGFSIEHGDGSVRSYEAAERDSLLATLVEAARGAGNRDVHVKLRPTKRSRRFCPLDAPLGEEAEGLCVRLLRAAASRPKPSAAVERFNANVPYSGLVHANASESLFRDSRDRPVVDALLALVVRPKETETESESEEETEAMLQCLRRLFACKAGFAAFTAAPGLREGLGRLVMRALRRNSEPTTHAAVDMLCALMHPMHDDYELRQEQLNKTALLGNAAFVEGLVEVWAKHASAGTGALAVAALLDLLTFALASPFCETTEGRLFDATLDLVARRGRALFRLFQHPCPTIVRGASLLMRALIEEAEPEVAVRMQELSLSEGALPRHLMTSLYGGGADGSRLAQRRASRALVALWLAGNNAGVALLRRILPNGLLDALKDEGPPPEDAAEAVDVPIRDNLRLAQQGMPTSRRPAAIDRHLRVLERHLEHAFVHWANRLGINDHRQDKVKLAPVVLRKGRQRVKAEANWAMFYYKFNGNHSLPHLIWNHRTREELRASLEKEVRAFESDRELAGDGLMAWNHAEFEVSYPSLKDELCVDGYYIRILLEQRSNVEVSLANVAKNLFYNLYHRFLLPTSGEIKCLCLQAMALVYSQYSEEIGPFADSRYIVGLLEKTMDRLERDRLVELMARLASNRDNATALVAAGAASALVELATLAHLHTARARAPMQSNVIEAGDVQREEEAEWHYCKGPDERVGPVTFSDLKSLAAAGNLTPRTRCWAQGMESWSVAAAVPQLRWALLARGTAALDESALAILSLDALLAMAEFFPSRTPDNAVVWPMSRLKQALSAPSVLPHLVQLLLTFDPVIVERVATLLCFVASDNALAPKLYLTGVFYFILMYTGSNVLPIARFLRLTHTRQAFRGDESRGELMKRSILGQLLPDAMVHYLENHGPDKFAHIFLGEFDTPEAIWSAEMRRLLIERIACHLADFTPRLRSNNRAQYQYAAIPAVRYPQLRKELFCNIFYLRHLCDTARFPDWPISDPPSIMRDVLEAWRSELEKKPPAMSVDEALAVLDLPPGRPHDEPAVRKAYYRLAQLHHPDKNPAGRERFEAVNKAYEFLCSSGSWADGGLNWNNILLIIRTQTILFCRCTKALEPFKYAGYNQLVHTIHLEMDDDALFSRKVLLLPAAVELAFRSIECSPENAEELNREQGFQAVLAALDRCVSVLGESTKDSDQTAVVCLHCAQCFAAAAPFSPCLATLASLPLLVEDLLRLLHFRHLIRLNCSAVQCISALASHPDLRSALVTVGTPFHLIAFLFSYDYTLEETVASETDAQDLKKSCDAQTGEQAGLNERARLAVAALVALGCLSESDVSPSCAPFRSALSRLLTPHVVSCLAADPVHDVLKLLTSNVETPYLVWNNATRSELAEFLEARIASRDSFDPEVQFTYDAHSSELVVGGVFLRVLNDQPAYPLTDAPALVRDLLAFIHDIVLVRGPDNSLKDLAVALCALANVLAHHTGTDLLCRGHFEMFFLLLKTDKPILHPPTISFLTLATRSKECISDVASAGVLVHLLLFLYVAPPDLLVPALDVLHGLLTSSPIVKELLQRGGLIYLLHVFLGENRPQAARARCAEVLGRLCEDPAHGPRARLLLLNHLPQAALDALRDSPAAAYALLSADHETPELIWDADARARLASHIAATAASAAAAHRADPRAGPPAGPPPPAPAPPNELVIAGVYVRLFLRNPAWPLRHPMPFLTGLLDALLRLIPRPDDPALPQVADALVALLRVQPALADRAPALGHLPRLASLWASAASAGGPPAVAALSAAAQLAHSSPCATALASVAETPSALAAALAAPETAAVAADASARLLAAASPADAPGLVSRSLAAGLPAALLALLNGAPVGAAAAARAAAALRALVAAADPPPPSLKALLDACPAWSSFRTQDLSLFAAPSPVVAALPSVPAAPAAIAAPPVRPLPSAPPPVDADI